MIEWDREPHQVFSLLVEVLVEDRAQPMIAKSRGSNGNRFVLWLLQCITYYITCILKATLHFLFFPSEEKMILQFECKQR